MADGPLAVRLGLALVMLLGASISDLRTRRVPNRYWIPFAAFAGVLWTTDLAGEPGTRHLEAAAWALGTCGFLYALWYAGLFGGADAKGLMVLAWLWPGVPDLAAGSITPTFDGLVNGSFLVLAVPVGFLLWNAVRGDLALPAMLLGVQMGIDRAESRHVWPMRRVDGDRLRWHYWSRPTDDLTEVYRRLRRHGVKRVWVTPKLPFMLNLSAGLVLAALAGNVALRLATWLVG